MLHLVRILFETVVSACSSRRDLALENLVLRQQLASLAQAGRRPRLSNTDRALWVLLSKTWSRWTESLVIVQPATVLAWHRRAFKAYWARKSRSRRPGRPPLAPDVRKLIAKMRRANPLWGAPRIHGKLERLGIDVSETTVSKYLPRTRKPPSQTWRAFLENHAGELASIDFFTVPTATFRMLFCFIVLAHDRRRILHFNVTEHPTAEWTAQQIVEAFPWDTAPRFMLRDRDAIYGHAFQHRVKGLGIEEVKTAPRSPWQKGYASHCTSFVPCVGSLPRRFCH